MSHVDSASERLYALGLAALRGSLVALDDGGSKMLPLMLAEETGCDAEITPARLMVQLGHGRAHEYAAWTVPAMVSWLVARTGPLSSDPASTVTAVLAPESVPYKPREPKAPHWSFARARHIRIRTQPGLIAIRIRPAADGLAVDLPVLTAGARTITGERTCPHCHEVSSQYRELSDRSQVCLACGRSTRPPT